ncbi:hypothetical protein OG195_03040 [Streptomyces sp. NBC_01362]|uniref:hypothetical protein n=1 Tax=Streptomyces sp. NBC_01362 TaxID=2903839 RepID=UPI002E2FC183|nr:hypothetical protein [Streptomyces sp. NBC_01362]
MQDDEAGGVGLRLDQLGQRVDERLSGRARRHRGGDTAKRQGLQKELRALAANVRADAEGRYASAEPRWQAGVEWALLWIENTAGQLTEGRS